MFRMIALVIALGALAGCKSYEQEWMRSQQQLEAAEARIRVLRSDIGVRDDAIAVRDQAIAERDSVIRNQCFARPEPEPESKP